MEKLKDKLLPFIFRLVFSPYFSRPTIRAGIIKDLLIMQLRDMGEGIGQFGKVDKVYLDNTNLIFALAEQQPETGNIRETVFFNQMRVKNEVFRSEKADFNINNITFEVGGKSKNQEQIKDLKNVCIVKDDIEYGYQNVAP
ncbi:MAG: hypothetical protein LBS79_04335 [Tannerella sp.]|jgi:hypothetical protein|nr:hypothetical protein [Tannerella sp.]